MIIVLMGYMGSGKSLIGRLLSSDCDFSFVDLDDFIEKKENASISDIFDQNGEIYFRKKEKEYLKLLLDTSNNVVISLGGGTPCFGNNIEILTHSDEVKTIYLNASVEELAKRLSNERSKRPLIAHLSNLENVLDFIRKHLFERSFYYHQADKVIKTDGKTPEEIVQEIKRELF